MSNSASTKRKQQTEQFVDNCVDVFRSQGGRMTGPRRAVIDCFANAARPLTAREVHTAIALSGEGSLDQVSVYRIIDILESEHLIHRVFPSGGYVACFHRSCEHAMYVLMHCTACDRVEEQDIPRKVIFPLISHLEGAHSFEPSAHSFQMSGLCSSCRD